MGKCEASGTETNEDGDGLRMEVMNKGEVRVVILVAGVGLIEEKERGM